MYLESGTCQSNFCFEVHIHNVSNTENENAINKIHLICIHNFTRLKIEKYLRISHTRIRLLCVIND